MLLANTDEPNTYNLGRLATRSGQNSANRVGLAMQPRFGFRRVLGEVLRAQGRSQFGPPARREAQGHEKAGFEATDRMGVGQEVVVQLGLVDNRRVGIRQQHGAILPSS